MIYETLLKDLKRANSKRKLVLAKKYGFNTIKDYEKDLISNIGATVAIKPKKATKKPRLVIHNVTLLDATGSMRGWGGDSKYTKSKEGINKEIAEFVSQKDYKVLHSIFEFIDLSRGIVNSVDRKENPKDVKFFGAQGSDTPLWKSIIEVIDTVKLRISSRDKVLIKIYTDGGNNTAGSYLSKCKDLIQQVQKDNFTVTFVGTCGDLKGIVRDLKLDESNTLEIDNTSKGFEQAFRSSLGATQTYATDAAAGKDVSRGFYKKLN